MLARLIRTGLRRGIVNGSRPWMAVGVAAAVVAVARRLVSNEPETVLRRPLQPGEGLLIRVREAEEAAPLP